MSLEYNKIDTSNKGGININSYNNCYARYIEDINKKKNFNKINREIQTREEIILKYGDSGNNVIILQEKLRLLGYFPQSITGSYGITTQNAVSNFQKDNGLTQTGNVDNITWELLFEKTEPKNSNITKSTRPVLKLGSRGTDVEELQRTLKTLMYYNGEITGYFDSATQQSVREFQSNNRLTADGIVGRNTWDALEFLYSPLSICLNEEEQPPMGDVYIVKAGDTLYSIALRNNVTVEQLKEWNNLTSNIINIGQKLYVTKPTTDTTYNIHVVKAGDTLYSIARIYNTTVDELKKINNLTGNNIYVGQNLKVPTSEKKIYTVQAGDTLYSIARRYNTTVDKLKQLNGLTSNLLSIGQQLIIE